MARQVQGTIQPVGIDDGRADTKIYAGEGRKIKIRTSVRVGIHASTSGLASNLEQESGVYEVNGTKYTVGDRIEGEDTRFEDFDGSLINIMAVHHALVRIGLGGQKVSIATGLPVKSYYIGGTINSAMIAKKRELLKQKIYAVDQSRPTADIVNNIVFSEALAAWLDDVLEEDGSIKDSADMANPVGIVDFGGRTLDTLWVNPPDQINHSRSGSETIGVLDLFDLIETSIRTKFNLNEVSRSMLEMAVRDKTIRLYGDPHDVTDIVNVAGEEISDRIEREIQRKFGSAADLDRILFVGGGVAALPQIVERYKNAVLVEDPEFANARGMYKSLRNSLQGA